MELEEVENPKIQERWLEVINHDVRVENAEPDDVDDQRHHTQRHARGAVCVKHQVSKCRNDQRSFCLRECA